jgi:stress-induced morphogen
MIDNESLAALIRASLPDADVRVVDTTGTMDHFRVHVRSDHFKGKSLLDQHRLVYSAVQTARNDGRIHALELRTETLTV